MDLALWASAVLWPYGSHRFNCPWGLECRVKDTYLGGCPVFLMGSRLKVLLGISARNYHRKSVWKWIIPAGWKHTCRTRKYRKQIQRVGGDTPTDPEHRHPLDKTKQTKTRFHIEYYWLYIGFSTHWIDIEDHWAGVGGEFGGLAARQGRLQYIVGGIGGCFALGVLKSDIGFSKPIGLWGH